MLHVRQENLPFVGSSHEFVGADQGDTSVSVFLFNGKPGSGPGPHRHPYDEIQFIREGRGINFVEAGEHLPDYIEGNVNDADLIQQLHHQQ